MEIYKLNITYIIHRLSAKLEFSVLLHITAILYSIKIESKLAYQVERNTVKPVSVVYSIKQSSVLNVTLFFYCHRQFDMH